MRIVIIVLLLSLSNILFGQNTKKVSGVFNDEPLISVLTTIEGQTGVSFYFKKEWINSLNFNGKFNSADLDSVLRLILLEQGVQYYRNGNEIIITNDLKIIESPEIGNYATSTQRSETSLPKGLIFAGDYEEPTNANIKVIQIGKRSSVFSNVESTIAGYVINKDNGKPILGALVYTSEPLRTATTDESGFYSLTLPKGKNEINVQFLSMKSVIQPVVIFSNGKLDFELEHEIIQLGEVTINADRDANVKEVTMGISKIKMEDTKNVPIVLGERDIMKIATTTAGVQTVGEGGAGFNVRGGKSDQNLILLNGANIYNANHFFGFFSVFNSDVIEGMNLYKSSIPAKYGGRLSSVFEIESKEGEKDKFSGIGGVSPITSRLTLNIPVIKGKAGLTVGGRTTYSNWVLKSVSNGRFSETEASFSDLVLRYDHDINDKGKISFSSYLSQDKLRLSSDSLFAFSDFSYCNKAFSLRWDRRFSDKLSGALTGSYAAYDYELSFDESATNAFKQNFDIQDFSASMDFKYYLFKNHELNFGLGSIRHDINPGEREPLGDESIIGSTQVAKDLGLESHIYLSDDFSVGEKIKLSAGLRYSLFMLVGPLSVSEYAEDQPKTSESRVGLTEYSSGEIVKSYSGLEPRLSVRYAFNSLSSVKASYNRNRQYLHNLTNSESLSPTDIWRMANTHILPQISDQYSLGYYRNVFDQTVEISAEAYYKRLQNMLDIKVGSQFLLNDFIETAILQGPGKSYGLEFSIRKSKGKFSGWLNYTYARTFIKLDGDSPEETINGGQFYAANYDKPHTVNLVTNFKLTRRVSFSYNFTYTSGRPVTYPTGAYTFKGIEVLNYSDRNQYRIPDYARMDVGINIEEGHMLKKLAHSYWNFSVYNVLGRKNPFSVFFDENNGEIQAYKLIVFGRAIPTVSFNFRF